MPERRVYHLRSLSITLQQIRPNLRMATLRIVVRRFADIV